MAVYLSNIQTQQDATIEAGIRHVNEHPMTLPRSVEEKSLLVRRLSAHAQDDELRRVSLCGPNSDGRRRGDAGGLEVLNSPQSRGTITNTCAMTAPIPDTPIQVSPGCAKLPQEMTLVATAQDSPRNCDTRPGSAPRNIPAETIEPSMPVSSQFARGSKRISLLADEALKQ
jgi:hypothetical protein